MFANDSGFIASDFEEIVDTETTTDEGLEEVEKVAKEKVKMSRGTNEGEDSRPSQQPPQKKENGANDLNKKAKFSVNASILQYQ